LRLDARALPSRSRKPASARLDRALCFLGILIKLRGCPANNYEFNMPGRRVLGLYSPDLSAQVLHNPDQV
jgi:hypothetical protein